MYPQTRWLDHSVTPARTFTLVDNGDGTVTLTPYGTVLQQGTNMNAENFNNMEFGIQDDDLGTRLLLLTVRRDGDRLTKAESDITANAAAVLAEVTVEEKTVTLTNSARYPFNNSLQTVSLAAARASKNYTVEVEVTANTGNVGEVVVSDKQLNGFKLEHTGSATSVTVKCKIRGGKMA